jgi:hypothetical protein
VSTSSEPEIQSTKPVQPVQKVVKPSTQAKETTVETKVGSTKLVQSTIKSKK